MSTQSPADQVKDAAWKYASQFVVLVVVFGGGIFVGYQMWGAGDMGQPALAARAEKTDLELNRIKNEREGCQKTLEVTTHRKQQADKTITELRKQLAAAKKGAAAPE